MKTRAMNTRKINTRNKGYRLKLGEAGPGPFGCRSIHLVHANDQAGGDRFDGRRSFAFLLVFFAAAAGISGSAFVWSLL
ncbi:hypothetical protein [Caulobacter sp. D4A]|uniref:hypothetical protein n=1 Tax=Caulobacter sp. D4A TaxID=2204171 RepID=UPI0011B7D0CC|nr:hypothetical protein [Caulobacter sp. D4A]